MPGIGSANEVRIRILAEDIASGKIKHVGEALGQIRNIIIGYAVARGLFTMAAGFAQVAKDAVGAATSLQTFNVGVETLLAREGVMAGLFDNAGDALANMGGNVQQLQADLRELSLASMAVFPVESIQSTWRLNMAYGATSDMAIKLTKSILTTAAALGLDTQMVQRLNYNLAQALVAGDLTAINLRQLRLAGLDLARVFQEELNMSVSQVSDNLKSGAMTLQEVSEAFIKYAEENFGTAAERMRNTLAGAAQEVKNLFYWAGVDLLTPSIEAVTGAVQRLSEGLKGLLDAGFFAFVGEEVGKMTERASTGMVDFLESFTRGFRQLPAVAGPPLQAMLDHVGQAGVSMTEAANEMGKDFGDTLGFQMGQIARKAVAWGANISTGIALGLVEGAVDAIVWAMNFITSLLDAWLGPGSPPKVAPDIDKWGAAMFTEWLHGFKDAEWGIFNSVARKLESVFRTLLDIGAIDEEAFGRHLIDYTKDLASALDQFVKTGVMSTGIFDKLRQIGGEFGKELESLLRKQFDLARATEEYNKITKAFEEAQKAQKAAREEMERLTAEYDELVATRAPKILVRQKKAEMDAAKARQEAADRDVENLEKQKDAAEERLETLKDQVRWQENLIEQLQRMYQWQRKIDEALEKTLGKLKKVKAPKLPKAKKGKAGEEEGMLEYPIPSFEPLGETAKRTFEDIREELRNLIPQEAWDNIDKMKLKFGELTEPWETLKAKVLEVIGSEKFATFKEDLGKLIPEGLDKDILDVAGAFLALALGLGVARAVAKIALFIFGLLGGKWLILILILALLKKAWDEDWQGMRTTIETWWENVQPKLKDLKDELSIKIPETLDKLEKKWNDVWGWLEKYPTSESRRGWLAERIKEIEQDVAVSPLVAGAKTWTFKDLIGRLAAATPTGYGPATLHEMWGNLDDQIQEWISSPNWGGAVDDFITGFREQFWTPLGESIRGMLPIYPIADAWDTVFGKVGGPIGEFGTKMYDLLMGDDPEGSKNEFINNIGDWLTGAFEGVAESPTVSALGSTIGEILGFAVEQAGEALSVTGEDIGTWAGNVKTDIETGLADASLEIFNWVTETKGNLGTWAIEAAKKVQNFTVYAGIPLSTWATDSKTNISTWAEETKTNIGNWASEAGTNVSTWATNAGTNIGTFVTNATTGIGGWISDTATNIGTWVSDTGTDIGTWKDDAIERFNEMGGNVKEWFEDKVPAAWQAAVDFHDEYLGPMFETLKNFINDHVVPAAEDVRLWFEEKITAAWDAVKGFYDEHLSKTLQDLKKILGDPVDSILSFLKLIVEWTEVRLKQAWEWVERAWNSTFGNVWRAIRGVMQGIRDAIAGAVAAAKELIGLIPQIKFPDIPILGGQFGGYMTGTGMAMLHHGEMALPLNNQIGINALARAMRKAMGRGAPMGGTGTIYIHTVNVYTDSGKDFIGQLQALAVPGGA